jgi:hypothetical protein
VGKVFITGCLGSDFSDIDLAKTSEPEKSPRGCRGLLSSYVRFIADEDNQICHADAVVDEGDKRVWG